MSKLDGKPEIAIVKTIEQEKRFEMTFKMIFNELKAKAYDDEKKLLKDAEEGSKLNSKGRYNLLFPILESVKINDWEKLNEEADLVDLKISNYSANIRNAIIELHTLCLINKQLYDEKNL
jgi:hypothetical protein